MASNYSAAPRVPARQEGYFCAYLMNSKDNQDHWKRGHSKQPIQRRDQIERISDFNGWTIKKVAKFSDKESAKNVERGLKGFGEVYQGNEWFTYDYSDRQNIYDKFQSLCDENNAISVEDHW